jgi:hypothetical protein
VVFAADLAPPPEVQIDPGMGPHQVLGSPRIEL